MYMKNIGKLFLAASVLMIFTFQAQAQNSNTQAKQQDQQQTAANPVAGTFVDKNNDGVCDNFESRSGNGRGANFVDKNGDGICDNRADKGKNSARCQQKGQGNQFRNGQGHGQGCGRGNCGRR